MPILFPLQIQFLIFIFDFKKVILKKLYLNDNQLTTLPESIGNLQSLEELWLDNNQFTQLPERICNLQNLQELLKHTILKRPL